MFLASLLVLSRWPHFFHFHPLLSSFILFHPLSSSVILFHPLSSSFVIFHQSVSVQSLLTYFSSWSSAADISRHIFSCLFSPNLSKVKAHLRKQETLWQWLYFSGKDQGKNPQIFKDFFCNWYKFVNIKEKDNMWKSNHLCFDISTALMKNLSGQNVR